MKRGQFLREMAIQKKAVQEGFKIGEMQSKQDFASGVYDAGAEFATGAANYSMNQNWKKDESGKWIERKDI